MADTPIVAGQTVNFDYCRNPMNGRVQILGNPQVDSYLTNIGKKAASSGQCVTWAGSNGRSDASIA